MYNIFILGISETWLTDKQKRLLATCDLIVGTDRFAKMVTGFQADFLAISPLPTSLAAITIALKNGNVAVLASGDPLFFGIGKKILADFPKDQIQLFPALSSIQKGCALFKTSWDDAAIISLHGRKTHHVPGLLLANKKNIVLTDSHNSPPKIAKDIINYLRLIDQPDLLDQIKVQVAEDIGMVTEKLFQGDLNATTQQQFSPLNLLLIQLPDRINSLPYSFGCSEENICHSRGLITKNEVRAATIHQLQLVEGGVFWDIGAGSGSVSVEAARSVASLTVFSIEHKNEEISNIKKNIGQHSCFNMIPVHGRAPEILDKLPTPDCVFIGGSSGSLSEIIAMLANRMASGGRLVINGVIDKTIKQAPVLMKKYGFSITTSVINVTRTDLNGNEQKFNPITIMTGTK